MARGIGLGIGFGIGVGLILAGFGISGASAETGRGGVSPPASMPSSTAPVTLRPSADPGEAARGEIARKTPLAVPPPEPVKVSSDPRPTYAPDTFVATMRAAERYRDLAETGGWPTVPGGPELKPAGRGPAVALLRRRLAMTGDLSVEATEGDVFDPSVADAVRRFQDRHGLSQTGSVGARTLAALNVTADTRARQLSASAGRLIGASFGFGDRYVAVNIPSATVEAVDHGVVVRRYVAVVGKPDRPSPTIATRITNINFNPTWTVPVSLIKKDIIPHVRKDAGYLARMKIKLLDGQGQEVDAARVNWASEQAVNYTIRQDPGSSNSLGDVRIDMPNKLAVYMHDTPSKRLFARDLRFESSGCVRVAGVHDLVAWLLDATPVPPGPATPVSAALNGPGLAASPAVIGLPAQVTPAAAGTPVAAVPFTPKDIEAAIASGRRQDVKLARPVPVAWVYLTGYATSDGLVHFRDDPYRLDEPSNATPPAGAAAPLTLDALVTGAITPR